MSYYTKNELLSIGFEQVGDDTLISKNATFYNITGKLGNGARIDDFAVLTGNVYIGDSTHVSPFTFLSGTGGKIVMEDGSGIGSHSSIYTKSDNYQDQNRGPRNKICGNVYIGEHSILGAQCVVLPGVTIGDYCSIGVGCVIHEDIQEASRYISMGIKTVRLP